MSFWKDITSRETWGLLFDGEAWEAILPTPKKIAIQDPNSKAFKKAWAKAITYNAKFGTPVPKELIEIYKSKPSPTLRVVEEKKPSIDFEMAQRNFKRDDDVPPPNNFSNDGVKQIPKDTLELSTPAVKILLGKDAETNEKVHYSPNDTTKTNNLLKGVIGKSGTGKTQYIKSHLYQLNKQSGVGVLILDIKGDYIGGDNPDFAEKVNAKIVQPYNMNFNPLSVYGSLPRQPIHTARTFSNTVGKIYGLGHKQIGRLQEAVREAYSDFGIDSDKPDTWGLNAPTIHDVKNKFEEIESNLNKENQYDKLNKMFDDLTDMMIFNPNSKEAVDDLFSFIDGITVISLTGYDESTQNVIIALMLDLFHSQMHLQGKSQITNNIRQMKKFILVDEAKEIMERGFDSLGRIMLQGREFGVGVILSTQELSHFKFGNYHDAISNWVILGSECTPKDISDIFSVDNKEALILKQKIGKLASHTSFVVDARKEFTMIDNNSFYKLFRR